MDLDKRLQMIRLCEAMQNFPQLSERIGLEDQSTFHGRLIRQNTTPPLSSKEPA